MIAAGIWDGIRAEMRAGMRAGMRAEMRAVALRHRIAEELGWRRTVPDTLETAVLD